MRRNLASILATLVGVLVVCGLGVFLPGTGAGRRLTYLSYDLPSLTRNITPSEIVLIYMTDEAAQRLQQRGGVWSRRVHADLVRRLTPEKPRAIFFDIVFSEPAGDPAEDPDLADALQENGRVFLAGGFMKFDESRSSDANRAVRLERTIAPLPMLRRAAAGWGLASFRPVDNDGGVRRLYTGTEQVPTATWRIAEHLGAPLPKTFEERSRLRWVNYYGPIDCFPQVPYDVAMRKDEVRAGFFTDKIVLIGGRTGLGALGAGKDDFRHPRSGWIRPDDRLDSAEAKMYEDNDFAPGLEVHATILANLLRGDWLERLKPWQEDAIIIGFGLLLGVLLPRLTPDMAAITAIGLALALAGVALLLFRFGCIWFAWGIPVLVQAPAALAWAIGSRYFLVDRRRNAVREAFTRYLSPHVVARLELDDMTLAPGGTIMETSIIFTDLEGFTTLSEEMNDPAALSELLTWYFTRATNHVMENDGTILKYIGDSVFAVWGAPLRDSRHAQKAARAACRMHRASEREIQGRRLRTRVGVHTGNVLTGNLGSLQRFDYTCIGDPVNLAARLEGLNKYLGTNVLVSEETHSRMGDGFITRCLGMFQLAGKKRAVAVYELVGEKDQQQQAPAYFEIFSRALAAYTQGDFAKAALLFKETTARRGAPDGPSAFYLERMAMLDNVAPQPWDPVVSMEAK